MEDESRGEIRLGGVLPNSKELHHTGTDLRVSPSLHLILAFFELSFTGDSVVNIWGEELENPIFLKPLDSHKDWNC